MAKANDMALSSVSKHLVDAVGIIYENHLDLPVMFFCTQHHIRAQCCCGVCAANYCSMWELFFFLQKKYFLPLFCLGFFFFS